VVGDTETIRAAFRDGRVEPTNEEREQGRHWVQAAVGSIVAVATQARRRRAVVGIGAPGLKTADGRGLAVVRNGPRIPSYAERVEEGVAAAGIELVRPIGPLTGDGDNCGRGEEVDRHGQFRDVANVYYIGGGTGLAEALKLRGRLVTFDAVRDWMPKAWQMTSERGRNFEDSLSTRGINAQYAADSGEPDPIDPDEFPEVRAEAGDVVADAVMKEAAVTLAREHGVYGTVRALGINYDGLKKRYETGGGAAVKRARAKGATFVEVKPTVFGMGGMPMGPVVELTTAEGQKLTVRLSRAEELEGTVTALVHACRRER